MRKNRIILVLAAVACLGSAVLWGCGADSGKTDGAGETDTNGVEEAAVLPASEAKLGEGEKDGVTVTPLYDEKNHAITDMITDGSAVYTVPAGVDGTYDIYLQVGKATSMVGTTIYDLAVNGTDRYALPIQVVRADAEHTDLYDMGVFLMAEDVKLKEGDEIAVIGKDGYTTVYGENVFASIPAIGDMLLFQAGTEVPIGYGDGELSKEETGDPSDPFSGKTICWLGSSVTYGAKAEGYSMADAIAENHPGTTCLKYTISGTTLADNGSSSYVDRLKKDIDPSRPLDLMVVQLSTNDAKAEAGLELGTVSESRDPADFDASTIIGGMETIIAYTRNTWDCPVVFYTGTRYDSETYEQMVNALYQLRDKWGIGIVDLWGNQEMTDIIGTDQYNAYMADATHPTELGYREWWTPEFEKVLPEYLMD